MSQGRQLNLMTCMIYYIKNLMTALFGENPYRRELEEIRDHYEKTAERVAQLEDIRFMFEQKMDDTEKQLASYQALVENLRERVREKDELIHKMEAMGAGAR